MRLPTDTINGQPYPLTYIGSVLVSGESPESLKLQPVFISNVQEWNEPSSSWTLFEKMPLDRHDTFQDGDRGLCRFHPGRSGTAETTCQQYSQ